MLGLPRRVRSCLNSHNDCPAIARGLWAAQFFFELDGEPEHGQGVFRCYGAILCEDAELLNLLSRR